MVIRAIVVGAVLSALLLTAEAAMACSCVPIAPKEKLADSQGAVTARLLKVKPLSDGDIQGSADPTDFVYRTGRVVKGAARGLRRGRRLVVRSVRSDISCGLTHDRGRVTGIFLRREDGRWTAGLCSQISRGQMLRLGSGAATNSSCA